MVECLLGRQAGGGQPGRCPARQQPTYQPAPSQPCPALGRPEPNSLRCVSGQHQDKRARGGDLAQGSRLGVLKKQPPL